MKWKRVKGTNDYYISNTGILKYKDNIVKPYINSQGYIRYILSEEKDIKISKFQNAHRLVAKHFIPNPNKYETINHKDFNKLNNNVENLEWCSLSKNISHTIEMGKHSGVVPVVIIDVINKKKYKFRSIYRASQFLKMSTDTLKSSIVKSNKYPIYGKYKIIFDNTSLERLSKNIKFYKDKVYVFDYTNKSLNVYNSISEASIYTSINIYTIREKLYYKKLKSYYIGGYIFSLDKNEVLKEMNNPTYIKNAVEDRKTIWSKEIKLFNKDIV